jgi:hypothetical protein
VTSLDRERYEIISRLREPAELLAFWKEAVRGVVPGWPVSASEGRNDGKAMEHLIVRAFEVERLPVRYPFEVRHGRAVVEQVDDAVHLDGQAFLLEAKDYSANVDILPVAKMHAMLARRPSSTMGIVFSGREFTRPAEELARYQLPLRVLLWDGDELRRAVAGRDMVSCLRRKMRYAAEDGEPYFMIDKDQ